MENTNKNTEVSQSCKNAVSERFYYVNCLDDIMKFGKYKGLKIKDVILKDYQYISFIQKKIGFNISLDCILLINECKDNEGISEGYFDEFVENAC